jgi:uncharacterized protein
MSKRTVTDYLRAAFFAKDKSSLAAIVQDAEENIPEDPAHAEPDGDEGKHASNVHVHIEHKGSTADNNNGEGETEKRLTALEDKVGAMDGKLTKVLDHLAKDENGNGDDDDKKKPPPDTNDQNGVEGAVTAKPLESANAELMEADPALKTGRSFMGDSADPTLKARAIKAMDKLVQDSVARAEILSPGIQMPTFDAAASGGLEVAGDRLCGLRRDALLGALMTNDGKVALGSRYGADLIKRMSCESVRALFLDASDRMRAANRVMPGVSGGLPADQARTAREEQAARIRSINAANKAFWERQTGRPN